jgi:polar amino acid transport system substrate-binding protein
VRKLLWLAVIAAAMFVLGACGGDDEQSSAPAAGGTATASADPAADLNLKSEGQLTVGAEFPVPGFLELPIDDPKGFEVDFANAIAQELGVAEVKWVNTPFSGLFSPAPKNFDVAINEITITDERAQVVDFSEPYFSANQGYLVTKGGPGEQAKSIAEMKDLQFGFQATTTGGEYIKNEIRPSKEPRQFSTLGAATKALANGQIDAFLMDVAIGSSMIRDLPDEIAMPGQFETGEQYGVLLQKGNALREKVNEAIASLESSGKIAEMQGQWFPGTEDLPVLR